MFNKHYILYLWYLFLAYVAYMKNVIQTRFWFLWRFH